MNDFTHFRTDYRFIAEFGKLATYNVRHLPMIELITIWEMEGDQPVKEIARIDNIKRITRRKALRILNKHLKTRTNEKTES